MFGSGATIGIPRWYAWHKRTTRSIVYFAYGKQQWYKVEEMRLIASPKADRSVHEQQRNGKSQASAWKQRWITWWVCRVSLSSPLFTIKVKCTAFLLMAEQSEKLSLQRKVSLFDCHVIHNPRPMDSFSISRNSIDNFWLDWFSMHLINSCIWDKNNN